MFKNRTLQLHFVTPKHYLYYNRSNNLSLSLKIAYIFSLLTNSWRYITFYIIYSIRCDNYVNFQWCQELKCVPIMEPPVAIDGGWGEWSSWSECSRTCGAGVSIMERNCDHPRPAAGGKFCVGERRRYRMCNIDPCPEDQPTFRAEQCSSYNNHTYEGNMYTWMPYYDKGKILKLFR